MEHTRTVASLLVVLVVLCCGCGTKMAARWSEPAAAPPAPPAREADAVAGGAGSDEKRVAGTSAASASTGNAAANAELSKNRAQAVQAALVSAGVAQDRTVLEKPAETTGTAASNAASRRVEVVLRK